MRISIVGAGPAGLYLAALMKKVDPSHEISIVERNAPDATFGWGVVFSEETLGELREADYESYMAITDTFARWDAIDIHHRGRTISSRGHAFSAISRKALLRLLEVELSDLDRFRDADLIVGADGVNSMVRDLHAEAMRPSRIVYESKFAWFGTDLVFDAFTFIFKETEWGLIQAHAYPFDAEMSTFIVECNDDVWERAGLGELDERASMAFCEELFGEQLGGHRLYSNRSLWMSFQEISNRSWHDGNVVILGDAAHTAHFTIGSGTKLAMESSLALANAFVRHGEIEAALTEYELERQPIVERFQEAARTSATYFENARHYAGYEPVQFAFNLLTRSGRIGYANMTLRDATFVRSLDSWFATSVEAGGNGGTRLAPPPMFAPLPLDGVTLANRIAVRPSGLDPAVDGVPGPTDAERYGDSARCGAGLVLSDPIGVAAAGRITPECPTLEGEPQAEAWAAIVEAAHAAGEGLVCAQLNHAGRRGSTRPRRFGVDLPLRRGGWPLVSASPIPYLPNGPVPAEIDGPGMERVRGEFAGAAVRAAGAGFDAVEVNLAHGYLLSSFLSPLSNRREDAFGGSLERRLAFPLEVLEAVRESWGPGPIVVRLSAVDWAPRGNGIEEGVEIARAVSPHCELVHVVAGQTTASTNPEYRRSFLTALAGRIRSETDVTTLVGGYITTGDEINTAVGAGRADVCLFEPRALA
jgi:anthraniloyl-CoA monooxygenase